MIREMQIEDLEQVAEIEKRTFSEPWSRDGFYASLSSCDTIYLVAELENRIVGYCGLLRSFDEADITNVAVDSDYRGRGIGRSLLSELMGRGRKGGIQRFTLEVRCGNIGAVRLYESLGFEGAGVRKNFYSKPREDALIMWTKDGV